MASKMQSPESFEKQSNHALGRCHSDGLQLPLPLQKQHKVDNDHDQQVLSRIQRPFSINSSSPLSNDFDGEVENTWPDRLDLPLADFERYDREPPSCSAYETIASDDLDEQIHSANNSYGYCFSQEGCDSTRRAINEISNVDLCKDVPIQPQMVDSEENACLEWPTIQQEAFSFNELSDVVLDSSRLSKETAVLLKLLDEGNAPSNAIVCAGNDVLPSNSSGTHSHLTNSHAHFHQDKQGSSETDIKEPWNMYSTTTNCSHSVGRQTCGSEASFQRVPFTSKMDFRSIVTKPIHSFQELANEAKVERQHRRKEKNRECSRNFRYKQRLKEDCLKKGKLEKEVCLRSRLYERERLRNALAELARNCASCSKAMEFLSQYSEVYDKENVPGTFHGLTRPFTTS